MKTIIIAMLALVGTSALAETIGPAGCGLGNLAFGGKDSQILASTTNGTSWSNVFGITSGTSNCEDADGMAKLDSFIESNKQALATDAARGDGETLASVAQILKCLNPGQMSQVIKENHTKIFSSDEAKSIGSNMRSVLAEEQVVCIRGA